MPEIYPFRGIHYSPEKTGDISDVITPPYDVISPSEQDAFYQKNQHNIVRLDFGKEEETDNDETNRYTRAADYFKTWLAEGILARDDKPAIYVYDQVYELDGREKLRRAFVSLVRLAEYKEGEVLPHENTHAGPKVDRLNLIKATETHFSQIFSLYEDEGNQIGMELESGREYQPLFEFLDPSGVRSILWRITDSHTISVIQKLLSSRPLYIADGHHRYETSLNYQRFVNVSGLNQPGADFTPMACVSMSDPGLQILPTHRAVKYPGGMNAKKLYSRLKRNFTIQPTDSAEMVLNAMEQAADRTLGMFDSTMGFCLLVLSGESETKLKSIPELSSASGDLDVSILHWHIFKDCLEIPEANLFDKGPILYQHSPQECVEQVQNGEYDAAFFVSAPSLEDMRKIVGKGEKMPPKSTFFYPKIASGFVLYNLKDEPG